MGLGLDLFALWKRRDRLKVRNPGDAPSPH